MFVSVVVVFAVVVVATKFIYSCHYEDTSYTLVLFLCMPQWFDDNHDLPQHVRRLLKWRDDVDGNKCMSILIFFVPVTDTVSIFTCHYMLFPFLPLHSASF